MSEELVRLFDALERAYPEEARGGVRSALVIAAPETALMVSRLLDLFGEAEVTVVGGDVDKIAGLRERLSALPEAGRVRIVQASAADLAGHAPGPYDLILIRRPVESLGRMAQRAAFTACTQALAPDGLLVFTNDNLADAAYVDELMQSLNMTMRPGSPYTAVPVALSGRDRYIMLYASR